MATKFEPGIVGEPTVQYWDEDTGAWVVPTGWNRKGTFRARASVYPIGATSRSDRKDVATRGKTRRAALDALHRKVAELVDEINVAPVAARMSVESAIEGYAKHLATTKAAGTAKLYAGTLERYCLADWSPIAKFSIERANSAGILFDLLQETHARHGHGAAKTLKAALSGLFTWAKMHRAVAANEVREIPRDWANRMATPKESPRDHGRALTQAELNKIFAHAEKWAAEDGLIERVRDTRRAVLDLMHVLAITGVRFGEALSLRWADVDLDAEEPTALFRGTKTKRSTRPLPLSEALVERLRARRALVDGDLVFPAPRGRGEEERAWDPSNCRRQVQKYVLDAAGFEWATPHTFRTTLATSAIKQGHDIGEVADTLGHASTTTTLNYYVGRGAPTAAMAGVIVIGASDEDHNAPGQQGAEEQVEEPVPTNVVPIRRGA